MKPTNSIAIPALALAVSVLGLGCDRSGTTPAPQTPPPPAPAVTASAAPAYSILNGKWLRPDGDYIIAIASVAEDGVVKASYFNPNPIHVGKAQASREAGGIKVVVVLQDANYPGSTYTLVYDAKTDSLSGTYYQAVAQETYDVSFVRVKADNPPSH